MENLFDTNKSLLKSMLLDEEKLITYVSVSRDLCVHVNSSKMLLQRIVEHVREETPDLQLNVNYIVCGATENNNARTIVCSEEELRKVKQCFVNKYFEHIYSVSKGHPNIDTAAYLTVNKLENFSLCSGLIRNKQCDKRTLDEIGHLKSNSQEIVVSEKSKSLPVSLKKIKQETNITKNNEIELISKNKDSQLEPVLKQNVVSPVKEVAGSVNNSKPKLSSIKGLKTQKGIAGFFNKSNNSNNINYVKKEINEKNHNHNETKVLTKITEIKCEKMEVDELKPIVGNVTDEDKKENSNKILNQIKKTSKVDKKRKRVLHVSDSDSDNEINDPFAEECEAQNQVVHDSEDEIPSTPTVTKIVIKSGIVNPRKRRKVVDKTYTDEDGYILTKKVEVYESCSDNEKETEVLEKPSGEIKKQAEVKKEISPKSKTSRTKKISPPQKGKQVTLTNFFKKV